MRLKNKKALMSNFFKVALWAALFAMLLLAVYFLLRNLTG